MRLRAPSNTPALTAALLIAGAVACDSSLQAPDASPAIEGEIVETGEQVSFVEADSSTLTLIWIKEDPADECGIVFRVVETTDLLIGEQRGSREDLESGRTARAWTEDGAVADSCPAQGVATTVQVLAAG